MFYSKFLSYSSHGKHILYSNDVNGSLNGRFVVKLILWSLPRLNFWSNFYRYKRHLVFQDVHILKLKSLQGHNACLYVLSRYEIFLTSLRDIIITFLHKFSNVIYICAMHVGYKKQSRFSCLCDPLTHILYHI